MKNQALFSSKDKSKKLKCRLLQFLFGALRVNLLFLLPCIFLTGKDYGILIWARLFKTKDVVSERFVKISNVSISYMPIFFVEKM